METPVFIASPGIVSVDQALTRAAGQHTAFSLRRLLGYAYREGFDLRRNPIRLTFALLGSVPLFLGALERSTPTHDNCKRFGSLPII